MIALADWLPHAAVGSTFTTLGVLKIYGLSKGIVGGGCKPYGQRLCGTCPSWSRPFNIGVILLFLAIGLGNLIWLGWVLSSSY